MKLQKSLIFMLMMAFGINLKAQTYWKQGIITDEFIFEKAPFPESHAATIAETPKGLVAAGLAEQKKETRMLKLG